MTLNLTLISPTRMRTRLQTLLYTGALAAALGLLAGPVSADILPRVKAKIDCEDDKNDDNNTVVISLGDTRFSALGEVMARADDGTLVSICWETEFPDKIVGKGSAGRIDQKREALIVVGFDCDPDGEFVCDKCTAHVARPERGKIVGKLRDEIGDDGKCRANGKWKFEDSLEQSFEPQLSADQAKELVEAYSGRKDVLVKDGKKARISIRHRGEGDAFLPD